MIQDIAPHQFKNEYVPTPPEKDSVILYYENGKCLVNVSEEGIRFLTFAEAEKVQPELAKNVIYLFSIDDVKYYLVNEIQQEHFPEYTMESVVIFRTQEPQELAFAGLTGYQLARWYESRRFCGKCGSKMVHDGKERMMRCEHCGHMEYPKICPAVIIGLTDGNRMMLTKYADKRRRRYALLAGFAEVGETLEETVQREVMEEVGLKVKNIRYYKSQPWSISDSLLAGFYCELDGDDRVTLDENELELAEWFEREEIPEAASCETLTNEMMMQFKYCKNPVDRVEC